MFIFGIMRVADFCNGYVRLPFLIRMYCIPRLKQSKILHNIYQFSIYIILLNAFLPQKAEEEMNILKKCIEK